LAYNRKVIEARKRMAEARAAEKEKQCSFKPTINSDNRRF